ncbi:uncharacterized protein METZ01_LOCUS116790, partial [marine metagenome]
MKDERAVGSGNCDPIVGRRSRRFEILSERDVNRDTYVHEWADAGLIIVGSPNDPEPGIRIDGDGVAEMDGRSRDQFDMIDRFIVANAIDTQIA